MLHTRKCYLNPLNPEFFRKRIAWISHQLKPRTTVCLVQGSMPVKNIANPTLAATHGATKLVGSKETFLSCADNKTRPRIFGAKAIKMFENLK